MVGAIQHCNQRSAGNIVAGINSHGTERTFVIARTSPRKAAVSIGVSPAAAGPNPCVARSVQIRLIKKFASFLNGVDLRAVRVGECVDLPAATARMIVLEGWAETVGPL